MLVDSLNGFLPIPRIEMPQMGKFSDFKSHLMRPILTTHILIVWLKARILSHSN